jgi:perosamine synthetase
LINKKKFIPVFKPLITRSDIDAVRKVLVAGWISSYGPIVENFEKNFSKKVNRKFSAAVSSGTAALDIVLKAAGIKKNDEIILSNFTIATNLLSVIKAGAKPILIDCSLKDWNIDIDILKKTITRKTKAIIFTHIYNFPVNIKEIVKICKIKKILLIEDSAEVLGLNYDKFTCGSIGDVSVFSLYANKQITAGEGGVISTNNKQLYLKFKDYRNLCFGKKDRFNHSDIGWNSRITSMQCALANNQLKRLSQIVKKKIKIGGKYYRKLNKIKYLKVMPTKNDNGQKNIFWVIGVVIKKNKFLCAKKMMTILKNKYQIETRPFFFPLNKQDFLKKEEINIKGKFPNSEYLSKYGFYVPNSLNIKVSEINYICNAIKETIHKYIKS